MHGSIIIRVYVQTMLRLLLSSRIKNTKKIENEKRAHRKVALVKRKNCVVYCVSARRY